MRMSLFWGMFLPLGSEWSVDRFLNDRTQGRKIASVSGITSLASFALILQCAYVYLFTALQKNGVMWRNDHNAVYYALGARDLTSNFGEQLFLQAPSWFFSIFTVATLLVEFAVPMLLLLPIRMSFLRLVAVILVISLHLGIAATMEVGLFPLISIASILVVLPSRVWESNIFRKIYQSHFRRWMDYGNERLDAESANLSTGLGRVDNSPSVDHEIAPTGGTIYLITNGRMDNRLTRTLCRNLAIGTCVALMTMWNVATVSSYSLPEPMRQLSVATGIYQDWSMFSPNPQLNTVWFVAAGQSESGEQFDVLTPIRSGDMSIRQPVVLDQSDNIQNYDKYWRKYFHAIRNRDSDSLAFAGYVCRAWNAENSGNDRLKSVTLTRASSRTLTNSERAEPVYEIVGTWNCT